MARTAVFVGVVLLLYVPVLVGAAEAPPSPTFPAAGSAVAPSWLQLVDVAQKIATIAALILGGVAAYYKFLRGRIFHARLDISMSSLIIHKEHDVFLQVQAQVKNTGASLIRFVLQDSVLIVYGANHAHRHITDDAEWKTLATVDGIPKENHKWIEPAETIYLNWLIDLPQSLDYAALKSELLLSTKKIVWHADTITAIEQACKHNQMNAKPGNESKQGSPPRGMRKFLTYALNCLSATRR